MKLLLAPNAYKESSDSVFAAGLFKKYLTDNRFDIIEKPISDGGDSFLNICKENFNLKLLTYKITNCYDDELIQIQIGYDTQHLNLYVESADILGLKVIPENKRNPGEINSKGLGDLLKIIKEEVDKNRLNVDNVFIGIGGTGTNDLGLGACSRFGLKLFDNDKELEIKPINYYRVNRIEWNEQNIPFKIVPVVDVKNELLGEHGATLTFGKQKGANDEQLKIIEKGFNNIIDILKQKNMVDSTDKLSGAGGGLAAGLKIFFNSEVKYAKDFILKELGIDKIKNDIDFVITGEGVFDNQSLMEKGTGIIIDEFKDTAKVIFLVCGEINEKVKESLNESVYCIELRKYFSSKEESIRNFKKGIELACNEIRNVLNNNF
ncbi:MAG: glycerate kinase [Ignavibacteriaceae bacterium]